MNSLESEYSFLAPTWRLPPVVTTSIYSKKYASSYPTNTLDLDTDLSLWDSTRYRPTYIPSTSVPRTYPITTTTRQPILPPNNSSEQPQLQQQRTYPIVEERPTPTTPHHYKKTTYNDDTYDDNDLTDYNQSHRQNMNRGATYATNNQNYQPPPPPPPQGQKRVQILDRNRHTPSTMVDGLQSGRDSHNSAHKNSYPTPDTPKSQQKYKPSGSNTNRDRSQENKFGYTGNNFNIHEYLYGPTGPDPGSYTNSYKTQQRRLQDEKLHRKSIVTDYKNFAQNGGFGPAFGSNDYRTYNEKIDSENKRKTYAKNIREINQHKIEEQKHVQGHHKPQKVQPPPTIPKYQRFRFLKPQAREYADTIERPHNLKPMSQTEVVSSDIPIVSPILITPLSYNQRRFSSDSNRSDSLLNQSRRSSSCLSFRQTTGRRVRFRSHDFVRHRSSLLIDLPTHIIGKSLSYRPKSALKSKQPKLNIKNSVNLPFESLVNKNEKKFINSHSMNMKKNMRLPPTATVVINQTSKPSISTSTNNIKKTISNRDSQTIQRSFTARSIPGLSRKSILIYEPDLDLNIKSYHYTDNE